MDENGNPLSVVPSGLSITGVTPIVTNDGYFEHFFGPNRPPDITSSSTLGTADVIVGGSPAGHGPVALGIGDGFTLNSNASGSIGAPISPGMSLVSSDVSQAGDLKFNNNSLSTYTADVLVTWNFSVTVQNVSSPIDAFHVDTGYNFNVARRTALTGGTEYFFKNGFVTALSGEGQSIVGSDSFETLFAVAPGEQPILTARTFVGGIGASPPVTNLFPGVFAYPAPEPSSLGLLIVGVIALAWFKIWQRIHVS